MRRWGYPRGKRMPEHLEIIGQNGSGKTFFEAQILRQRALLRKTHVVMIATKKDDATVNDMGWPVIDSWPPNYGQDQVIFWVKKNKPGREGTQAQAAKVADLLDKLWTPNANRIVAIDEIAYVEQELKLRDQVMNYYRESRALGITMVASTQRPQGLNRWVHSESAWTVVFGIKDMQDAERTGEILGDRNFYRDVLRSLDREKYEFLIKRNLTGESYISWIDNPLPPPPKRR